MTAALPQLPRDAIPDWLRTYIFDKHAAVIREAVRGAEFQGINDWVIIVRVSRDESAGDIQVMTFAAADRLFEIGHRLGQPDGGTHWLWIFWEHGEAALRVTMNVTEIGRGT